MPGEPFGAQRVWADQEGDAVYYVGANALYGQNNGGAVFRFSNNAWDTVAHVIGGPPRAFIKFHDTLIVAGGGIDQVNGDTVHAIAYFNGTNWLSFPNVPQDAGVRRFRVIDDTLYAALSGWGEPFVRLIDGQWETFGQLSGNTGPIGLDIVQYNGEFFGAVVGSSEGNSVFRLVNGTWENLGAEITGGISQSGLLAVFQNDLYIGGTLLVNEGLPGQGICRWDGSDFHALGMGLQVAPGDNSGFCGAIDMIVHDDLLFVSTGCNYVDGAYCPGIATWDGEHWCTLDGVFVENNAGAYSMDFLGDTMYVGCGPTISDVEVGYGARGRVPLLLDSCQLILSAMEEPASAFHRFHIHPNPTNTWVALAYDLAEPVDGAEVLVRDISGRVVARLVLGAVQGQEVVDTRGHAPGTYVVEYRNAGRTVHSDKLIIQ